MNGVNIYLYGIIQFVGYLVQILPLMFLFYAPYRQEALRFSKRKLLLGLGIFYVVLAAGAAVLLGVMVWNEAAETTVVWIANVLFALGLAVETIVYFLSLQSRTSGKILFYMFVVEYGIALYVFNKIGVKFLTPPNRLDSPYDLTTILIYLVCTAVTFPLIYYFLRRFHIQEIVQMNKRNLRVITGCSIFIVVLTIVALQGEVGLAEFYQDTRAEIYESILMICLLLSNVVSYFIYFFCTILEWEKEKMGNRLTAYELQYTNLYEGMEREKRLHHNLRHHFRTLGTLASDGRMAELQAYIDDYLENLNEMELRQVSRNPVVNSVLSYYIQQAEEENIQVQCDIQVKDDYAFNIKDMTVLLGNAMENALAASRRCPRAEARIRIMLRQYKKSILIKIENSLCPEEKASIGGKLEKSYGLASIEMIARKYEGSVDVQRSEDTFTLRIVLNLREQGKGECDRCV